MIIPFAFFGLSGLTLFIIAAYMSGKIVENEFDEDIYIKEEDKENELLPALKINKYNTVERLDGIATAYSDKVYKVKNGIYVRIDKDGNVIPTSFISRWINSGWKSKDDFNKYDLKRWKLLFDKAENLSKKQPH